MNAAQRGRQRGLEMRAARTQMAARRTHATPQQAAETAARLRHAAETKAPELPPQLYDLYDLAVQFGGAELDGALTIEEPA